MIQGTYYKEWSSVLNREMEFKVYGSAGVPVLALPARGGRFYDWENNGMPDAIAPLLNEGKVQLFCADSIDGEAVLNGDIPVRRRAEMEEKYFVYLTAELAPRVLALNGAAKDAKLWCVGIDLGAVHAVNCRLRRPKLFAGAIGLSGIYDLARFWGSETDDLVLRCSPLQYLAENGIADKLALAKAKENSLMLCAGQVPTRTMPKPTRRRWPMCWPHRACPPTSRSGAAMSPTSGTGGARCWACLCRGFWRSKRYLIEGRHLQCLPSFCLYFSIPYLIYRVCCAILML